MDTNCGIIIIMTTLTEDRENSFLKDIVFYRHAGPPGCDLQELGTLSTDKKHAPYHNFKQKGNRVDRFGWGEPDIERGYLHFSNKRKNLLSIYENRRLQK